MREELREEHLTGLEEALLHGGGTMDLHHVLAAVERGDAQLWVEGPNAMVTEVIVGPKVKGLHFWLATGTLDGCIALSNKVMDWGREVGCTVASLTGRPGWAKALAHEGWGHRMVEMGRRL